MPASAKTGNREGQRPTGDLMEALFVFESVINKRFRRARNKGKTHGPKEKAQEQMREILRIAGGKSCDNQYDKTAKHGLLAANHISKCAARDLEQNKH